MTPHFAFASPRKLPKPESLQGQVVVLDLAFASEGIGKGFAKTTGRFIEALGPRLACWVDHHDHPRHAEYSKDPRFVLATKAQHGGCPEMISPELVERAGPVDTILAHFDLDGIYSAVKWALGGIEPYPGADDDARAVDTRTGDLSDTGAWFDAALRADWSNAAVRDSVIALLLASEGQGVDRSIPAALMVEQSAQKFAGMMRMTKQLAERFEIRGQVAVVSVSSDPASYDKTELLLLGQKVAPVAMVIAKGNATIAANFDSGINFLEILGIGGGMPTRVSVPQKRVERSIERINESLNAKA